MVEKKLGFIELANILAPALNGRDLAEGLSVVGKVERGVCTLAVKILNENGDSSWTSVESMRSSSLTIIK